MQYLCTEQTNHGGLELGLDAVDIWLLKSHVVYVVRNVLTDGASHRLRKMTPLITRAHRKISILQRFIDLSHGNSFGQARVKERKSIVLKICDTLTTTDVDGMQIADRNIMRGKKFVQAGCVMCGLRKARKIYYNKKSPLRFRDRYLSKRACC